MVTHQGKDRVWPGICVMTVQIIISPCSNRLNTSPPSLPHHGYVCSPNVFTTAEGNEVRLLFTIVLAEFRQSGILERVKPGYGGKIPKQCSDPGAFHASYATAFVKYYEGNFKDQEAAEQRLCHQYSRTTHYLLLATHYSLLTTHHSPLTTHYS